MSELELMMEIALVRTPLLNVFFESITALGTETFIILSLPLVWHLCGKRFTVQLFIMIILSFTVISFGKEFIQRLRPYYLMPELWSMDAPGFSMPSGHSLLAFIYWSMLMTRIRNHWFNILASFIIIGVGFSRVYFSVHYPSDVLAGWSVGALCLLLYIRKGNFMYQAIENMNLQQLIKANILITFMFHFLYPEKFFVISAGAWNGFTLGIYRYLQTDHIHDFYKTHRCQSLICMILGTSFFAYFIYLPAPGLIPESYVHLTKFVGYFLMTYWISYGSHKMCGQWVKGRLTP